VGSFSVAHARAGRASQALPTSCCVLVWASLRAAVAPAFALASRASTADSSSSLRLCVCVWRKRAGERACVWAGEWMGEWMGGWMGGWLGK
jgi:hypothetical protein